MRERGNFGIYYDGINWVPVLEFRTMNLDFSIWITSVGLFMASVINSYVLYKMQQKQQLAYFGDKDAARHLILPCYKPLFRSVSVAFLFLVLASLVTSSVSHKESIDLRIVEFCSMCCVVIYSIPPVLLLQPSVSRMGFWRTAYLLIPWWMALTILWVFSINLDGMRGKICLFSCNTLTVLPPLVICVGMWFGIIPSRMQLGSRSNRSCVEFLLCYCTIISILMILSNGMQMYGVPLIALSVLVFLTCQLFPVAMYRTLLADTKFWRGLGKHNKGGITESTSIAGPRHALPELTMKVAAHDFQSMLGEVSDLFIDFAFIHIGPKVGSGASADVYRGSMRQTDVAVKVSTPPEVTAEELLKIQKEAVLNSKLLHPCIVRFYGICVRPPQIGIVIEYCDHGNLRSSLETDIAEWTPLRRIEAALDACRAVAYVHSLGYMHRDIKPDNFFVTYNWKIKLGDFGESTTIKNRTTIAENGSRMTVLGTVAYMAPELVHGDSFYSEAIDIYALSITMWQIWTGNDPFDGVDTFSLYDMIVSGKRPPLPKGAPVGFSEVLSDGWDSSAEKRLSAQEMADRLIVIVDRYRIDIERHRPSTDVRPVSSESHESMLILGNCSLMDDNDVQAISIPMGHISISPKLSQEYDGDEISSPVHSPIRTQRRHPLSNKYDSLEDVPDNEEMQTHLGCDISIDMSGYTDDELYQGYGRKSAVDIKRSNPLIPQLTKSIIAAVSPSPSKKKQTAK